MIQYNDHIRIFHRRQAVGNNKNSPALHQSVHPLLYDSFCTGINRGSSLVQDHDRRICHSRPGNGQKLPLSLRQVGAVFCKKSIIAFRKPGDKVICSCQLRRGNAFFICSIQFSVPDILHYRPGKQVGILEHDSQGTAKVAFPDLIDIDPVIPDLTVGNIIKPVQQIGNSSLSCAGSPYKGHLLPRLGIKGNIMEYSFSRLVSKIYIMQPHIPFQSGIGYGSGFPVRMFPGPQPCPLLRFLKEHFSLSRLLIVCTCLALGGFFPDIDQGHIPLILFRLLIHQPEDSFCTGDSHNHCVYLMGHLADIPCKLFRHIQEGHHNTDPNRNAGYAHIGDIQGKQNPSCNSHQYIKNISDVIQNRPQYIGILVCFSGFFKKNIVVAVKVCFAFFLMTENFDNLLSIHHFFYKAFHFSQGVLLFHKKLCRTASYFLDQHSHYHYSQDDHQGQPEAVIHHDPEDSQYSNTGDQKLGKALGDHLTEGVDIVGIIAHNIPVIIGIKVFNGKTLHFSKHLFPHFFQCSLGHDRHQLIKSKACCQRKDIKDCQYRNQSQDLAAHCSPVSFLPVILYNSNDILHKNRGYRAYHCIKYNAGNRRRQHHRIKTKHGF